MYICIYIICIFPIYFSTSLGFLVSVLQNRSREIGQSVDLLTFKHEVMDKKWLPDSSCSDRDLKPVKIGFEVLRRFA